MPSRSFQHELVGVFGLPVAENPTQAMMEAAFADMGLHWRYLSVEVQPHDLGDAVRGARAMGFRGFNCTMPHKVAVIPFLDRLNPAATAIGAVNCVINQGGVLVGDNTDGKGFLQSVAAVRSPVGREVLILGAGGAARAIAVELALAGARRITLVNRSPRSAHELAYLVGSQTPAEVELAPWSSAIAIPETTDLVVNATSIGLYPHHDQTPPLNLDSLKPSMIVCDVIPNPPRTRLIQEAEKRGCTVLDGLGMLVNQGVIGLALWSGQTPRPEVMRQALEEVFAHEPASASRSPATHP